MSTQCLQPASMDRAGNEKIRDLERNLGASIIALEPECHWAELDQVQLEKLKSLERELDVILLAYTED